MDDMNGSAAPPFNALDGKDSSWKLPGSFTSLLRETAAQPRGSRGYVEGTHQVFRLLTQHPPQTTFLLLGFGADGDDVGTTAVTSTGKKRRKRRGRRNRRGRGERNTAM